MTRRPGHTGSALRLAIVAIALDGSATAAAAAPADQGARDRFAAWAGQNASESGAVVASLTEVELDGDNGADFVARVCHHDGWAETVLVESAGRRWEVAHESWGHAPVCAIATTAARWHAPTDELRLIDTGPSSGAERRLAIIDAELVVTEEWSSEASQTTEARWDLLSQRQGAAQGRVVPVRVGNRTAPERGPTFITEGRAHWSGPSDAELRAVAERRADGTVLLRVTFADDQPRLGPSGDGVDVWWSDPRDGDIRRVRIRSDEVGRLQVVSAGGGPLPPQVHGEVHRFEFALPFRIAAGETMSVPLSIEVHDVDDVGTTILATSEFDGQPATLGLLRYVPGGGNFEAAGRRIADASRYDALPSPPSKSTE